MELGIHLGVGGLADSWEIHARASVAARMPHLRSLHRRPRKLEHLRVHSTYARLLSNGCLHIAYQ